MGLHLIPQAAAIRKTAVEDRNIHHGCSDVTVEASEVTPLCLSFGERPRPPFTSHVLSFPHDIFKGSLVDPLLRTSNDMYASSKLAVLSPGMGWVTDLPLRASNEHIPIVRVPRAGGRPGCIPSAAPTLHEGEPPRLPLTARVHFIATSFRGQPG